MDDENPFTKSQTIDPEVRAYVYSLVNALGGTNGDEDGHYALGDDALAVLRDLKRWLKLYDEKTNRLDVARCLAEAKLVTGDLLPILASWVENGKQDKLKARIALACLELMVPLTWPLEHGEMTANHHRHTPFLQQAQVLYKAGILSWDNATILRQAIRVALPSIALKRDERTARDEGIIKLLLYFLRNVTVIRQVPNLPSQGLENEVSRSTTIESFRAQDVFALLLTMCSNMGDDFNLQDVIILEILFNLIKGVNVHKLWMTESQRRGKEVSDLKATLSEEAVLHKDAKKNEWSRHGRFGTMIWVKRDDDKMSAVSGQDNLRSAQSALLNIDKSKKWSKPQRKQKDIDHTIYDFDRETVLTSSATEKLRNFVEEFLDSGFNPLSIHLRKAIEREAERLLDVNYRQYFYTVSWFLEAELVRREKQKKEVKPVNLTSDFGAESFGLIAGVLNQEMFITLNRLMQIALDNKEWQDLNACMRCFTRILLAVQEMTQSPLEEDQEIAENIQNRIFYEETTHDRIIGLLKGYKDQGFGYLDSVTELSHVFLRMLERYSKENADLQIRSRRRAKAKRKAATKEHAHTAEEPGNDEEMDSENEDAVDIVQISQERKFDFKRFAAKFTSQSSVDTFITFTSYFSELSVEQQKRAHRFFYRVAFKQDLAVLLYRVDIVALFYKMTQGPEGLSRKHPMFAEWSEFSKQLFRKLFKKLDQRPELLVELLFSKINKTLYYIEHGHDKIVMSSSKPPAEIEIRPSVGLDKREQIGVVVTLLIQDEKQSLVTWIKTVLAKAFDERRGWEAEAEARERLPQANAENNGVQLTPDSTTIEPPQITIHAFTSDVQSAMCKNARFRLLMKLVGCETLSTEDIDGIWTIPARVTSKDLATCKAAIEFFENSPWTSKDAEETPEDMIHRVRLDEVNGKANEDEQEAIRDGFIDDSEGDDNPNLDEEFLFPDNIRSKPKRNIIQELKAKRQKRKRSDEDGEESQALNEEQAARRKRARDLAELERRRKIKSNLYVRDSDDESDPEKDREFFIREEELRKKQELAYREQMALAKVKDAKPKRKRQKKAERKRPSQHSDDDGSDDMHHSDRLSDEEAEENDTASSSQTMHGEEASEQEEEDETPLSSPNHSSDEAEEPKLKEKTQLRAAVDQPNAMKISTNSDIELVDVNEVHQTANKPLAFARRRGGFIIDSDDDDE